MSYIVVPLKMPHTSMHSSPPKINTTNFSLWQFLMESRMKSCSVEVWNIIDRGFSPVFPSDLTRNEVVDCQLNATALNIIQNAMSLKELAHIRSSRTAKGAWEKVSSLFTGNASIQESNYEGVSNE